MWEWIVWITFVLVLGVLGWVVVRLVRKTQEGDRRYGNPDNWKQGGEHW
jgi:hypothetical protein